MVYVRAYRIDSNKIVKKTFVNGKMLDKISERNVIRKEY